MAALAGDYKSTFYQSLRSYEGSPANGRNRSLSPKNRKELALLTMTTFPKKYVEEMKAMRTYQQKMDRRLASPKFTRVAMRAKGK